MAFLDYYEILSVPPTATQEQIERAYKRLVSISHPDLFGSDAHSQSWATERMKQINEAYGVLKDPGKRAAYDRGRREHQATHGSHQHQHQQRQQYREPRVPCPLCEQHGRVPCLTCEGRGDAGCPGCDGTHVVVCPLCAGVGTLTEAEYREFQREWDRAQQQAKAEAARQEAEAVARQRAQEARQAAEARRRIVLAGVGVLCLLFVARSCAADIRPPVASSTVQVPAGVQPTPYRPFIPPVPERTQPRVTATPRPSLRSIHSRTPTQVSFQNETSSSVRVFWIDYSGREVLYRTLAPGESYVQPTYATHPWRLRDETTGRPLRTMIAGPNPSKVVVGQPRRVPPAEEPPAARVPSMTPPARETSGDEYVRRGIDSYRADRYGDALTEFRSAVQVAPRHDEAWAWLGMTYVALGRKDEALAAFQRSVELNPHGRQASIAQEWIAKLRVIGSIPTPAVHSGPIVRSLNELSPILQLQTEFRTGGMLVGQPYRFAVIHANRSGLIVRTVYNLNGQYDRFEVTVGMEGSGNLLQQAAAKVYGDGELLFESPSLGLGQTPVKVSVSVKGVTRLELQTTGLPVVWTVIWADPRLIKD